MNAPKNSLEHTLVTAISHMQAYTDLYQYVDINSKAISDQKQICVTHVNILQDIVDGLMIKREKDGFEAVLCEYFIYCKKYFIEEDKSIAVTLSWAINNIANSFKKYFPEHKHLLELS